MVTKVTMRLDHEVELMVRPRSEVRNQFIRENLAELRERFRGPRHYVGAPTNYRRPSRNKVRMTAIDKA